MIFVENKRKSLKNLQKSYPNGVIIDVTSKADEPFVRFSPFYPHGNIPIPYSENQYSMTVEGIWQGLKVFRNCDIDKGKFLIDDMKNIKRTERKYGNVMGHRKGIEGKELLNYDIARKDIYLKTYAWVLDNLLKDLILKLKNKALEKDIILLDYETNIDIYNFNKPLSHAGLIKRYIEKKFPEVKTIRIDSDLELKETISKGNEYTSKTDKVLKKKQQKKKKSNKKNTDDDQISIF